MTICAIHQPNFFPWLGYFDKIHRADVFVFLDSVAYPRMGSKSMASISSRVKVSIGGEAKWIGCSLKKAPSGTIINDIRFSDDQSWRQRMLGQLAEAYADAPSLEPTMDLIEPLVRHEETALSNFNIHAIEAISASLGLTCRFVRQSELKTSKASTDLLIEILNAVGSKTYLCGGGAGGYQEDHLFKEAGLDIVYQNFEPRTYGDPETFMPGLSVIDFLMRSKDWSSVRGMQPQSSDRTFDLSAH